MSIARAFIALGANLPFEGKSPAETLARAAAALTGAGLRPLACSSLWETAAWPPSDQPPYVNAVIAFKAAGLEPAPLYAKLRDLETAFGRNRRARWDARTLDLDILAIDGLEGVFGDVELPHPRMTGRAFVLAPLAEIAPDWAHPGDGRTASDLLAALGSAQGYRRLNLAWAPGAGQGG